MSTELFSELVLQSGARLRNRVAKAAMEESMAGSEQLPDERLISLYRRWGAGGAGPLITGNRVVRPEAFNRPGGGWPGQRAPPRPLTPSRPGGKAARAPRSPPREHPRRQ